MFSEVLITSLVGIVTSVIGAVIAIKTFSKNQTSDLVEKVKKDTELHMKLDFISNKVLEGNSEIKIQLEKINAKLENHEQRIIKLESKEVKNERVS